jgi:hypothetical protein
MRESWSLVIPILDEVDLFKQAFPSCVALCPDEVLLCLNEDYPREIVAVARALYDEDRLRIVTIPRDNGWRFPQACARVEGFKRAENDRILNIDVDNILYPSILKGLEHLGQKNVALVSFRKDITYTVSSRLREKSHRLQNSLAAYCFQKGADPIMGAYWIYRPYYFDVIDEDEYRLIYNGSDTYLYWKFQQPGQYRRLYLDESCCRSLRHENEGLTWRQLEVGLYHACRKVPLRHVIRYSLLNLFPLVLKGYYMGLQLPDHVRRFIGALSYEEFLMFNDNKRWLSR